MLTQFALPQSYLMPVLGYLFFANCLALAMFGMNRATSEDGDWGMAEMRVLVLSILGGWIGAKLGRMMYPADEEPRSFGSLLNLTVLAVPAILLTPWVLHRAPDWIGTAYVAYVAQYADEQKVPDDTAEPEDATGVVAAAKDSPATAIAAAGGKIGSAVNSAAQADADAPLLPKRFGPGSEPAGSKGTKKSKKSTGFKIISVDKD